MKPEPRAGMLRRTARGPVRALREEVLELNPRASSSNTAYSSRRGVWVTWRAIAIVQTQGEAWIFGISAFRGDGFLRELSSHLRLP